MSACWGKLTVTFTNGDFSNTQDCLCGEMQTMKHILQEYRLGPHCSNQDQIWSQLRYDGWIFVISYDKIWWCEIINKSINESTRLLLKIVCVWNSKDLLWIVKTNGLYPEKILYLNLGLYWWALLGRGFKFGCSVFQCRL